MSEFIFVGTLHQGFTPCSELIEVLSSLWPDQLLIQVVQKDLLSNNLSNYSDEMQCALTWAEQAGIAVAGFDVDLDTMVHDDELEQQLLTEQSAVLKSHSWKDMNSSKNAELLFTPAWNQLVDQKLFMKRQKSMLANIHSYANPTLETVVVVTGCTHLDFFARSITNAQFPLR